ncbi:Virion structural protein [Xanthomonas phage Suba]|uniref:Virion structural protein n=1 Tax=Xanthomonas phage Suba TaxID=2674975 RepID=A0A679KGE7_9CAUD|nr:Virion structural protein [Xanthomonas phage Suba]CAA2409743.1 Virion structural protein [Xanthomonas phage Suba]
MTDKILYFTAGRIPTTAEKAEIAAIEALCVVPYSVGVRNPIDSPNYGTPEEADYVAGTVPEEEPYASLPEFDPADPPNPSLPADKAIVGNGDSYPVTGGTVSVAVAGGVPTFTFTPTP